MAYPTLYPNSTEIYAEQYTSQLSSTYDRQITLAGSCFPFMELVSRKSGSQTHSPPQTRTMGDERPTISNHTTPIPDYLLQPIYPWMKSKKGGKAEFGFGMSLSSPITLYCKACL